MRTHLKSRHPTVQLDGEPSSNIEQELNPGPGTSSMNCTPASSTLTPSTSSSSRGQEVNINFPHPGEPVRKRGRQLKLLTKKDDFDDRDKINIDRALVKMIGVDLQPLSIVENKGFREYSSKLQPHNICFHHVKH